MEDDAASATEEEDWEEDTWRSERLFGYDPDRGDDVWHEYQAAKEDPVRDGLSGAEIFGIWRYWVRVRGFREAGFEQSKHGLRGWPVASAYGPSMEGAGTRVCGYAIKNSEQTVV